jgi:hypothetical protein
VRPCASHLVNSAFKAATGMPSTACWCVANIAAFWRRLADAWVNCTSYTQVARGEGEAGSQRADCCSKGRAVRVHTHQKRIQGPGASLQSQCCVAEWDFPLTSFIASTSILRMRPSSGGSGMST